MRLLYICHNHPDLHAGGTEIFALNLFCEMKAAHGAEALFVACVDDLHRERRPGTLFQAVGGGGGGRGPADEMLMWTGHFDRFYLSQTDTHAVVPEFEALLRDFAPDVVHFHHGLMIGLEAIALVRRVLPAAKIVFTLHDYYPICANDGQMVTTDAAGGRKLCGRASPDACRRCFPEIEPGRFVLREMHAKHLFGLVDRFVAPSEFLRRRYVDWGLAPERIAVVPNGQAPETPAPHRVLSGDDGRRNRFAFFGHINRFKGASVAVQAAQHLLAGGFSDFTLDIHGSAEFQPEEFRAGFLDAVGKAGASVRFHGGYRRDEMAALVAETDWVVAPSVWWENAPLVIQEAFLHKRPVICSGIGGMAEMVRDGVDGLHFRPGDAAALAALIRSASLDRALWERLVAGIPPVRTIADAARDHERLYASLTGPLPDLAAGGARPRRSRKAPPASGCAAAA
jgi:glycosyltransferase involved in cell wall biosynthesis